MNYYRYTMAFKENTDEALVFFYFKSAEQRKPNEPLPVNVCKVISDHGGIEQIGLLQWSPISEGQYNEERNKVSM